MGHNGLHAAGGMYWRGYNISTHGTPALLKLYALPFRPCCGPLWGPSLIRIIQYCVNNLIALLLLRFNRALRTSPYGPYCNGAQNWCSCCTRGRDYIRFFSPRRYAPAWVSILPPPPLRVKKGKDGRKGGRKKEEKTEGRKEGRKDGRKEVICSRT